MRTDQRGRPGTRTNAREHQQRPRSPSEEWLYGRNAVYETLRANRRRFRRMLLLESAGGDPRLDEIRARARALELRTERVDRATIDAVAPGVNHQGIALLVSPYPYAPAETLETASGSLLALDHLLDPQNVGTLLRAAEAFGVRTVILPRDRAAGITPAVVNSSAGAVEYLDIVPVVNLSQELERLKKRGLWVVGIENHQRAAVLGSVAIPTPCVLMVGSEGQGMSPNLAKRCDLLLKIPMTGEVNSLNAATAGSLALFALAQS